MLNYANLLPPTWQSIYLPFWFQEDFAGFDISSALLGDAEGLGQILFKSSGRGVLAGSPFVEGIFNHLNCQ